MRRFLAYLHILGLGVRIVVGLLHNVTVDQPAIEYSANANWLSAVSPLNMGGSHMLSTDPAAQAIFRFTGVAVYFMSSMWPYPVASSVSLDGVPRITIDLMDLSRERTGGGPETIRSAAVWAATGLANIQHTLVVSAGQSPHAGALDPQYVIVDGFIYTVDDGVSSETAPLSSDPGPTSSSFVIISSSSAPTDTQPPSPPPTEDARQTRPNLPSTIIAAIACSVAGFFFTLSGILFIFWWRKRRRRPRLTDWTIDDDELPSTYVVSQETSVQSFHLPRRHQFSNGATASRLRPSWSDVKLYFVAIDGPMI
ncbi:hypothetical protein EYR40_001589 [Pleurotus pulmonarius]|nr:hypothetical protein EYR36_000055 [Pleurotus pulmonarius]KAF4604409.1 hypothetical protein EYR38_004831 [Pleurotus pulmonarius]KAF4609236.1 hypothetical protein EYR40_001589 [Pleurotus pulmonarius]